MGWFSADEIVAPTTSSSEKTDNTAQTVSLCILAGVAVGYLLFKAVMKLHRQQTERAAERVARRVVAQV